MSRLPAILGFAFAASLSFGQLSKFTETTVAGTPQDLMIVRHIVIKGDNYSIGKKLAEIARKEYNTELFKLPNPSVAPEQANWLVYIR
jgi:hypothetical protein